MTDQNLENPGRVDRLLENSAAAVAFSTGLNCRICVVKHAQRERERDVGDDLELSLGKSKSKSWRWWWVWVWEREREVDGSLGQICSSPPR